MIIEFADPGYNWAFLWWPLLAFALCVTAFILTSRTRYVDWDMSHWVPSLLGPLMIVSAVFVPLSAVAIHSSDYAVRVGIQKALAISEQGYSNVNLSGDRFTASTEDGKYFSGVLIDLHPESGYAYQVLELTETGD